MPSCPKCGSRDDVELLENPVLLAGVPYKFVCWADNGLFMFCGSDAEWALYRGVRDGSEVLPGVAASRPSPVGTAAVDQLTERPSRA
jgi:hypothetical protein